MNDNYKGTEHYTLTKTENGWHGDPNDCEWQWFHAVLIFEVDDAFHVVPMVNPFGAGQSGVCVSVDDDAFLTVGVRVCESEIIEFDRVWRVGEVDVHACSSCRSIQMFVSFSGFLTASLYTSDSR